jgi:hypothetical protein
MDIALALVMRTVIETRLKLRSLLSMMRKRVLKKV